MTVRNMLAVTLLLAASTSFAQDEGPWSGSASFGFLSTSGNTENSSLNTGLELGYATGNWAHTLETIAIYADEDEVTTAEAYEAAFKTEWEINGASYLFGRLRWRKDRFSSYDTQFSQALGYGYRIIDTDTHRLSAEVGAGARQSDLVDGTTESEFITRAGLDYEWNVSETATFEQTLGIEAGDEKTYVETVTSLSAKVLGDLALVASYTIKHNTDVLPGTEETDTYTALTLEYRF